MGSLNTTTNTQDQKKRHQCTSSPWCRHCLPCFSKLNINKTLTFSPIWEFCGCRKTYKLFSYIVYMNFRHMSMYHNNAFLQSVWYLALRAVITEMTPVWTLLNLIMFTIYCKIWTGRLPPLYAPILALWCSCLYIYTVWLVYCAIVLHVWNKAEWAWPSWKWVCHFYLTK